MILADLLHPESQAPLVEGASGALSRTAALERASVMQNSIGDARLVLLQSDDPAEIVCALVAAQMAGSGLILAHATLTESEISSVIRNLGVDGVLRSGMVERTGLKPVQPLDSRIILMTSGSTGSPKLAEHTIESLVGRIAPSAGLALNRQARWLLTYQPTAFAGVQVQLTALLTEGTLIVPSSRTPGAFWTACRDYQVTHVSATPTFWRALLIVSGGEPLLTLRQITLGGEAVDQPTLDRLKATFPEARITHIYASTEAGALFAVHDQLAGFPAAWLDAGVDDVKLRIRDERLEVWSPRRMVRYSSGQALPLTEDGWLSTTDLVRVEGSRVLFAGRSDSVLNVGGTKVSPEEVEAFLLGIEGVAEAKVRGVANPITGQLVVADIVVGPGYDATQVRQAVISQSRDKLQRNQVPRQVNVVAAIPVASSGKKAL